MGEVTYIHAAGGGSYNHHNNWINQTCICLFVPFYFVCRLCLWLSNISTDFGVFCRSSFHLGGDKIVCQRSIPTLS